MLFDGLVELLRLHGFPVTVEHELRLQRVLPHLDKGCKGPVELCDILCPLFATTQEQQEAFGPIFERWLRASGVAAIEPKAEAETPKPENAAQPWYNRRRTYLALIPVVVLGVALSVPQVRVRPLEEVPKPTITQSIQPIETPAGRLPQIVTTEIKYPPPPAWMPWWQARRQWIYGVIGTVLLLWTLFEIWRYQRRQVILQRSREERERPPHRLPLSLTPQQAGLGQDSTLAGAARWMRQREVTGSNAIDIPATIREAIKQAGFVPAFLERQRTREPAYLMLIDRQGFRDHQMALFDEYAAALKRRNVDVTVLHFEGDPRYPVEGSWDLMVQRHGGDRLLLATDGEQLRHPKTGLLWSWVARDFKNWAQRALLTPLEPERWGARERELGTVFAVWSAAPDSLLTLSRGLSGSGSSGWRPRRIGLHRGSGER